MLRQTLVILVLLVAAETRGLEKRDATPLECHICLEFAGEQNCVFTDPSHAPCTGFCAVVTTADGSMTLRTCSESFGYSGSGNGCSPNSDSGLYVCVCRHDLCNNASIEQIGTDECSSSPCQNGGTCVDDLLSFQCTCPPGSSGRLCEIHTNMCSSAPCKYGATCNDLGNGFNCTCASGWAGTICTININECTSSPCQNGATCFDLVNKYYCKCAVGYNGTLCTTGSGPCNSSPCGANGLCNVTTSGNYICQCYNGFTGTQCETNINECASNPCAAPKLCKDMVNAYDCACPAGFDGADCSHRYYNCTGVALRAADPLYCDRYFTCLAGSTTATNDKCPKAAQFQLLFDTKSKTCMFNSTATRMPNCTMSPVNLP